MTSSAQNLRVLSMISPAMRVSSALVLLAACSDASLGKYNTAPDVTILVPAEDGLVFAEDETIDFLATAADGEDDPPSLQVSWTSGSLGEIGSNPADATGDLELSVPASTLGRGEHVVTVTVVDGSGEAAHDSVTLQVGESEEEPDTEDPGTPPVVILSGPTSGSEYQVGDEVTVIGKAVDADEDEIGLTVYITSSIDGTIWTGNPEEDGRVDVTTADLSVGDHTLALVALDSDGNESSDSVDIVVVPGLPEATITNPVASGLYFTDDSITFEGEVSDVETASIDLLVSWLDGSTLIASSTVDSSGYTATSGYLSEGTHVITLEVQDEAGNVGSDSVTIDVYDPNNYDDDGDGYTENEGDCDDDDSRVSPGESEICDALDNDCDGDVNEDYWDGYEANESSSDAYDLGEVDIDSWWTGSSVTITGLTLHESGDADWFTWYADDEIYDPTSVTATVQFPSTGNYTVNLYLNDGGWTLKDSATGNGKLIVEDAGNWLDTNEDDWALEISASTWPSGSCSSTYSVEIES